MLISQPRLPLHPLLLGPSCLPQYPLLFTVFWERSLSPPFFLAGIIPGVLLGLSQMGVVAYYARKRNYPKGSLMSVREALKATFDAALVLMMPLIILGGILTGIFTPTESACVAVFYALIISLFVYRDIKPIDLPKIIINTAVTSSLVMLVIGTASIFSWLLASKEIPQYITEAVITITHNRIAILLLINIVLLMVGTFMETTASLIILTPVLLPLMNEIGVDPLHFGVILVLNLVIGLTTPPVGVCLFIACAIGEIKLEQITKAILPFLLASIIVLLIVTYWESLIMVIPKLFGYRPLLLSG